MTVTRRCRGSRFCQFTGPFHTHRLIVTDDAAQSFLGGCWYESLGEADEAAQAVCNRCAHRSLWAVPGGRTRLWLLLCPFCGEPLGQDGARSLVLDRYGAVVRVAPSRADHIGSPKRGERRDG